MSTGARIAAASVMERVLEHGAYSQHALRAALSEVELAPRDRGWVTRAVYGALSDLRAVDLALDRLVERGIDSLRPRLRAHLRIALWEIGRSGAPNPGPLVSAAVDAVKGDGLHRQSGLCNGVLRSLVRDRDKVFNPPKKASPIERFGIAAGLPDWIASALTERLGDEHALQAAEAYNTQSPVCFRARGVDRDDLVETLRAAGLDVEPHPFAPDAGLCRRGHLAGAPGHGENFVIQDAGAQLATCALPPTSPGSILDASAGLGGKTLCLVDRYGPANVVASDISPRKLRRLSEHPELGAVETAVWAVGEDPSIPEPLGRRAPYSAVVLDAPCSALGTLGRHPEVRWNRRSDVVTSMADVQRRMLDALADLVAPAGYLLFIVCTWTPEETRHQVERFLTRRGEFQLSPPDRDSADERVAWDSLVDGFGTVSLWPRKHLTDGFFIARFRREA